MKKGPFGPFFYCCPTSIETMGDAVEQPRQSLGELDRRILHRVTEATIRRMRAVGMAGIAPDEVPRLIAGVTILHVARQQQGQLITLMGVLGDATTGLNVKQTGAGPHLVQRQTVLANGTDMAPLGGMVTGKYPGQAV